MIAAAVIFGITYLIIASGKISHVVIVLLGASLMVLIGVITSEEAFSHIDLSVILLLAGMMVLADIIARTGAFDWSHPGRQASERAWIPCACFAVSNHCRRVRFSGQRDHCRNHGAHHHIVNPKP